MENYLIKGMTDLALEYDRKIPHFIIAEGKTMIWVVDDHNLILRSVHIDRGQEEWCKLFKEFDVWYLVRRNQEGKENSEMVDMEAMNKIDSALYDYLAEIEFLNGGLNE